MTCLVGVCILCTRPADLRIAPCSWLRSCHISRPLATGSNGHDLAIPRSQDPEFHAALANVFTLYYKDFAETGGEVKSRSKHHILLLEALHLPDLSSGFQLSLADAADAGQHALPGLPDDLKSRSCSRFEGRLPTTPHEPQQWQETPAEPPTRQLHARFVAMFKVLTSFSNICAVCNVFWPVTAYDYHITTPCTTWTRRANLVESLTTDCSSYIPSHPLAPKVRQSRQQDLAEHLDRNALHEVAGRSILDTARSGGFLGGQGARRAP